MKKQIEKRRHFCRTLGAPRSYDTAKLSKLGVQGEGGKEEEGALRAFKSL